MSTDLCLRWVCVRSSWLPIWIALQREVASTQCKVHIADSHDGNQKLKVWANLIYPLTFEHLADHLSCPTLLHFPARDLKTGGTLFYGTYFLSNTCLYRLTMSLNPVKLLLVVEMPHGHMPVLYVDGEELAQSQTIARYLARKYGTQRIKLRFKLYDCCHSGLAGRGEWEQAKVDEILDFQKDLHKECLSYIFTSLGFQKGDLVRENFGLRGRLA